MRIFELILDQLSETLLFEMAFSRKLARDRITSLSPEIFEHLVKLYVFESPENQNHWISEINAWLNQINRIYLKPSNKKPSWQTIYNWMVFDAPPHYDQAYILGLVQNWTENQYRTLPVRDHEPDLVLNEIFRILEQAAKDIAQPNKFVSVKKYLNTDS